MNGYLAITDPAMKKFINFEHTTLLLTHASINTNTNTHASINTNTNTMHTLECTMNETKSGSKKHPDAEMDVPKAGTVLPVQAMTKRNPGMDSGEKGTVLRKAGMVLLTVLFLLGNIACKPGNRDDTAKQKRDKRVFAHLMPQRLGDYGKDISYHQPLIGEHDPLEEAALEYHILTAKAARIDGFILNPTFFKAGDTRQNKILLALVDKICSMNEQYPELDFWYIYSYDDNIIDPEAVARKQVLENYAWLREHIINHPVREESCFRDNVTGKKVMMVWSAYGRPYHWEAVGEHFGHDSLMLITRNRKPRDRYSDGSFSWVFMDTSMLAHEPNNWGRKDMDDFLQTMGGRDSGRVAVSSVYPGFDDRKAPWGGGWRYIPRYLEDGEVMALTWDKNIRMADQLDIPWIQIVTWNDWPEGSSVQPGTIDPSGDQDEPDFGYQALETCRRKIIEFKKITDVPVNDQVGMRIPYEIYTLRKDGEHEKARKALDHFLNMRYEEAMEIMEGRPMN